MIKEIEKELKASIKQHLPSAVGDTLRQRLDEADQLEKDLKVETKKTVELNKIIDKQDEDIKSLRQKLSEYRGYDEREYQLNVREAEIGVMRDKLELERLQYQLQSEKDKTDFAKSLAMGLVRNTDYRSSVHKQTNLGGYYNGEAFIRTAAQDNEAITKTESAE